MRLDRRQSAKLNTKKYNLKFILVIKVNLNLYFDGAIKIKRHLIMTEYFN